MAIRRSPVTVPLSEVRGALNNAGGGERPSFDRARFCLLSATTASALRSSNATSASRRWTIEAAMARPTVSARWRGTPLVVGGSPSCGRTPPPGAGGTATTPSPGTRSKNAAIGVAPDTPSRMAWWSLAITAVRPAARPSATTISQSGRSKGSDRLSTWPTSASGSRRPPGVSTDARWTCASRSMSSSSTHTRRRSPAGVRRGRRKWRGTRRTRSPTTDRMASNLSVARSSAAAGGT